MRRLIRLPERDNRKILLIYSADASFLVDPKVREYVRQVIRKSVTICGVHLRSVILFGSAARGQFSEGISDIDLIFVVSDDTPKQVVVRLDSELGVSRKTRVR